MIMVFTELLYPVLSLFLEEYVNSDLLSSVILCHTPKNTAFMFLSGHISWKLSFDLFYSQLYKYSNIHIHVSLRYHRIIYTLNYL